MFYNKAFKIQKGNYIYRKTICNSHYLQDYYSFFCLNNGGTEITRIEGGILALKYGEDLVVDNAVAIAQAAGISEKLISLTIVAISTGLPELITSVTATIKGETDMAIGNIVFALFPFIGEKHKMTRENGILFTIVYIVYMINVVIKA